MRRGAPVPVAPLLTMPVIFPKLALGFGGFPEKDPRLPEGLRYVGWLNKLKAAARKFRRYFSASLNVFVSEPSISKAPGPRAANRPRLPQVPFAGRAKAAGFSQLVMLLFAGYSGTPATRFGRCPDVFPSGKSPALRETVIFSGSPVRA